MFRTLVLVMACLGCISLEAQSADAVNTEARAAALRALLGAAPRLGLEAVALSAQMPEAASLGIVSSVATDRSGIVYALQRGDKADPVIAVDREGRMLRSWGKGMYTVPHSVRIDPDGNVWTVDAGSSMILKFSPEGRKLAEISVGEVATGQDCAFPTLCGTTDITFASNGRLFISDGYGNARILEYTAAGKRVKAWGSKGSGPGQFRIPHGIANDGKTLFVADRENARIQRFDFDGRYLGEWTHLGRPFALKMTGGALWVALMTLEVGGPQGASKSSGTRPSPWIAKVDPASGKVLGQVESPGPHAIDISDEGEAFATGCCGGSNPSGFFWLRTKR
jgi:DNA-binding beta-propeller fold protein YncE